MLAFRLDIETMDGDAHSGSVGVLPSASWLLIDAINAIRNVDGHVMLSGFGDVVLPPSGAARAARLEHAGFGDVEVTVLAQADPISTPIDHPLVRKSSSLS